MPAARHFSRSPCIASAVKAMIGTGGFPCASSNVADLARGGEPVHLRHLVVHQHDAVVDVAAGRDGFEAVDRHVDLIAEHLQHPHRGHLVGLIVFGEQDARTAQVARLP